MTIRVRRAADATARLRGRWATWRTTTAASAIQRVRRLVPAAFVVSLALLASSLGNPTVASATPSSPPDDRSRVLPVTGAVLRGFDRPPEPWLAGHRGVDLAGTPGQTVLAAADGVVTFAGHVAGIAVITVEHAPGLRTTYQPVTATIPVGTPVHAGDALGTLMPGHCAPQACLHWGLRTDTDYLDPLAWLRGARGRIRLLPSWVVVSTLGPADGQGSERTAGTWPVDGPLTSAYGYRTDPITGQRLFHDGVDIGAPCGTLVRAPRAGTISWVGVRAGFGNRVEIDHGRLAAGSASSSYSHLADASMGIIRVGQRVAVGEVIGVVGSTGRSTGCHLHFSVTMDGLTVDPGMLLS